MGVVGLVELKKRIKSIESTSKLTKAMSLVATSKLKKVRRVLALNDEYSKAYKEVIDEVKCSFPEGNKYSLFNNSHKKLVLVIASDMGMCGTYNNSILEKIKNMVKDDQEEYTFLVLGERGKRLIKRHGFEVIEYEEKMGDVPEAYSIDNVFDFISERFLSGSYHEVIILYTYFKNTISREVKSIKLFPVQIDEQTTETVNKDEFDIEGDGENLVDIIVPSYCKSILYNCLLNSKASEHSVRMETMNSANSNAEELIADLKIKYNRIRQGAITQEISEIVGGVDAQG